jgi:hypothetical protein
MKYFNYFIFNFVSINKFFIIIVKKLTVIKDRFHITNNIKKCLYVFPQKNILLKRTVGTTF